MIITALWAKQPGKYFCISTKSSSGKWRDEFFKRSEFREVVRYVRDNSDKDVYFCPHGFDASERNKKHAVPPTMLYADLDEIDPRKVKFKPTIAIESSPGRYVGVWLCDKPIDEQLNRRMTYALGGDRGGWDFSQVLRVPGTTNYKYNSLPRVRLLWDDGPVYTVSKLDRQLPETSAKRDPGDGLAIYRKYESKLASWARREILRGKPRRGDDRSVVLWKLEHHLFDVGMTFDEAFAIVKMCPWNKFAGRSSEDDQIERELSKILSERTETKHEGVNGYHFLQHSLAEIEERDIDWIWYPYLARREVTLLEGDPSAGKSWICQMACKSICDGERLPEYKRRTVPFVGKVAYFTTENDAGSVTKKRLRWNGLKNMHNFYQEELAFTINDEENFDHALDALEQLKPTIIVFDTINLYIGDIDTGRGNQVTQALQPFLAMAKRFNCSVVLIRHLTKGSVGQKAMYRGQGNMAFSGTCRIQLSVGTDPEDAEVGALGTTKVSFGPKAPSLMFTRPSKPTLRDPDRCLFQWGEFRTNLSSDDILAMPAKNTQLDDAVKFLKDTLADEALEISRLEVMAEKRSISRRTLYRAADSLNVIRNVVGFGKTKSSTWELPE